MYQSAYGIVLALRFAVAQTGHESRTAAPNAIGEVGT